MFHSHRPRRFGMVIQMLAYGTCFRPADKPSPIPEKLKTSELRRRVTKWGTTRRWAGRGFYALCPHCKKSWDLQHPCTGPIHRQASLPNAFSSHLCCGSTAKTKAVVISSPLDSLDWNGCASSPGWSWIRRGHSGPHGAVLRTLNLKPKLWTMLRRFWFTPNRTWGNGSALQAKQDYGAARCPLQNGKICASHSPALTEMVFISQKFRPERNVIRMKLKAAACMI